jgi:hypothetical protein
MRRTMTSSSERKIRQEDKVPLRLSLRQRDLILEHALLDPETEAPLRLAEADGKEVVVRCTLTDLDELAGAVAAVANHCEDERLQRQLDATWDRIDKLMHRYDDGLFNDSPDRS